jgi:hypothetical protein
VSSSRKLDVKTGELPFEKKKFQNKLELDHFGGRFRTSWNPWSKSFDRTQMSGAIRAAILKQIIIKL